MVTLNALLMSNTCASGLRFTHILFGTSRTIHQVCPVWLVEQLPHPHLEGALDVFGFLCPFCSCVH